MYGHLVIADSLLCSAGIITLIHLLSLKLHSANYDMHVHFVICRHI